MLLIVAAIVCFLGYMLFTGKKPGVVPGLVSTNLSPRDQAINEELTLVGEAYRTKEVERLKQEALAKVAAISDGPKVKEPASKSK